MRLHVLKYCTKKKTSKTVPGTKCTFRGTIEQ